MTITPLENVDRAETLLNEGRLDEAVNAYTAALNQDPDNVDALLGAGNLALSLDMPEEARQFSQRLQELAPDSPQVLVFRGMFEEASGSLQSAQELYTQAIQKAPDDYATQFQLGRFLLGQELAEQAIPSLRKALELAPDGLEVNYALGYAYRQAGELASSIEQLSDLVDQHPSYLDGVVTLVEVLAEAGEVELAQEYLKTAEVFHPEASLLQEKRAALQLQAGDLLGCLATLQALAEKQEDPRETLYKLTVFSLSGGQLEIAAAALEQLLAKYPGDWRGHHLHAQFLGASGRDEEAVAVLKKAHSLAPQRWEPLNDLGDLLNVRSQTYPESAAEAVDVLTQACRIAPVEELAPRFNLILAYWNAGHNARAREAAELLVQSHDPKHPLVQRTQEVLDEIKKLS